ncbi:MAG: hypothetical protein CVU43_00655 [Chloroflexi bacterium HGW-Chloroflexi-5]|jgi:hypothetical protein|nr:MAG: hypothetical protein CVU43_00655 [Chloroflexi bacterium HGW-Chloroflexi-5]
MDYIAKKDTLYYYDNDPDYDRYLFIPVNQLNIQRVVFALKLISDGQKQFHDSFGEIDLTLHGESVWFEYGLSSGKNKFDPMIESMNKMNQSSYCLIKNQPSFKVGTIIEKIECENPTRIDISLTPLEIFLGYFHVGSSTGGES